MRLRPKHVRTRLTAWYVAVLAAVLLIYGGFTSGLLLYQLRGQLDHQAIEDLETVEGLLSFAPDGKVLLRSDYHDHPIPRNWSIASWRFGAQMAGCSIATTGWAIVLWAARRSLAKGSVHIRSVPSGFPMACVFAW